MKKKILSGIIANLVIVCLGCHSGFSQYHYFSIIRFDVAVGSSQIHTGGLEVRGSIKPSPRETTIQLATLDGDPDRFQKRKLFILDFIVTNTSADTVMISDWAFKACCPENSLGLKWQQNSFINLVTPYIPSENIILLPGKHKQFYSAETDFYWCLPKNEVSLMEEPRYFTALINCAIISHKPNTTSNNSTTTLGGTGNGNNNQDPIDSELLLLIDEYKKAILGGKTNEATELRTSILEIAGHAYPDRMDEINGLLGNNQPTIAIQSTTTNQTNIPQTTNSVVDIKQNGNATGSGESLIGEEFLNVIVEGDTKHRKYIKFILPAGVKRMEIRTSEGVPAAYKNAADLFVKYGSIPTTNDDPWISYVADCASLSINRGQDACLFENPQAGEWHVMLYNYNSSFYASNLVVTIVK